MNHQSVSEEVYLIIINKENDPQLLQTISPKIKTYIIGRNLGSKNPLPFIRLNRVISQLNPDVVHVHNHHIIPVLFKQKNTRYFFTAHTNGINILQYNRFDKIFSKICSARYTRPLRYRIARNLQRYFDPRHCI